MFTSQSVRSCSAIAAACLAATLLPANGLADQPCSGHKLLSTPRPEGSCRNTPAEVFVSPDKTLRALVVGADVSLDTTPDMESRVVIRSTSGDTVTSKDHSSPRGANGYYVYRAKWSPDSQYFVYSMVSSGGHSPWQFPTMVFGRRQNRFVPFSDMINGNPTVSGEFKFTGPHMLIATTWKQPGSPDDKVPITVDLDAAFQKLKPSED
jgi:hypothetical protein